MASRIVVFGATGYTGRLVTESLLGRGARPVLAGRSAQRLRALAAELGEDLEVAEADVDRPGTVRALVSRGDVLVSTVGPFTRWGAPAVQAAVAAGAHYLDSTGEPAFIRQVFERFGRGAQAAGCGLVTAFGYDFVPGNLAGALALHRAGPGVARVDVGYFFTGRNAASGGTLASLASALTDPAFAWRGGRLVDERSGARARSFVVDGRRQAGISIGASEHFGLPRVHPGLREVNVYLGWFGPLTAPMRALSAVNALAGKVPGVAAAERAAVGRVVKGSTGGPDASARARSGSHVVAAAYDAGGGELAHVELTGPNGYSFTGDVLAWGAETASARGLGATGALAPVEAFGLDGLRDGCAKAGLVVAT
ncbi:MAG TPA: saccharopine dehydrogenase NADP-binding domain-containing protein [Solirubrobacteraceae bacterium]|nr:saccharopine dehydrogenase NADP-binding domain-containing protein [Solirubrobacteraceae bacterium]